MLEVVEVSKRFGGTQALRNVSITATPGQVTAIVGPSGCGKTTLLRTIAGLEHIDEGDVLWQGESMNRVPPHRRSFGLVFQEYALFPHLDVGGNVAFGPTVSKSANAPEEVARALELVGLSGFERRSVETLSGGEQQRVALARTLATRPKVLMLDEPVSALDRALRDELLGELDRLLGELDAAVIYVTHDQAEALSIADQLVVMAAGEVHRMGTPAEIWANPGERWTAEFLSVGTVVEAPIRSAMVHLPEGRLACGLEATADGLTVLLRSEAFELGGPLTGEVAELRFRGPWTDVVVIGDGGTRFRGRVPGAPDLAVNQTVRFGFRPDGIQQLAD